jgi:hypothetical protein
MRRIPILKHLIVVWCIATICWYIADHVDSFRHSKQRQNRELKAVFDSYLLLVDTCHVVGTVLLYKCWPLVRFSRTVDARMWHKSKHWPVFVYLSSRDFSIPTTHFCLTDKTVVCVCVLGGGGRNHGHALPPPTPWTEYTSCGDAVIITRQTFVSGTDDY